MIGIDNKIDKLNSLFNSGLFTDIIDNSYSSKGRAFLNQRDGVLPELYINSTNEYLDILLDDKIDGQSFFIVDSKREVLSSGYLKNKVGIYFAVNLTKLYPSVTERAVEYLHRDVSNILVSTSFNLTGIVTGHESFSDFTYVKIGDNMQPYYLVRFDTEIEYSLNC